MPSFYSDCHFNCDKIGTIDGVCNKVDGYCHCREGFYGDRCEKGKKRTMFTVKQIMKQYLNFECL